jgi:hypothetical protein
MIRRNKVVVKGPAGFFLGVVAVAVVGRATGGRHRTVYSECEATRCSRSVESVGTGSATSASKCRYRTESTSTGCRCQYAVERGVLSVAIGRTGLVDIVLAVHLTVGEMDDGVEKHLRIGGLCPFNATNLLLYHILPGLLVRGEILWASPFLNHIPDRLINRWCVEPAIGKWTRAYVTLEARRHTPTRFIGFKDDPFRCGSPNLRSM